MGQTTTVWKQLQLLEFPNSDPGLTCPSPSPLLKTESQDQPSPPWTHLHSLGTQDLLNSWGELSLGQSMSTIMLDIYEVHSPACASTISVVSSKRIYNLTS